MNGQDCSSLLVVGQRNLHRPVETSGAQQCGIEDLGSVGRCQDNYVGSWFEPIHVRQQLVECLLAFVVRPETTRTAPPPDGVDLIDEDDRRGPLSGVGEQIPHPGRTDTNEHLDKARAAESEKRYASLAGDRSREQSFSGPGRAHHEHSLRTDRARGRIALRMLEEVHDFHDLSLGTLIASDVRETGRRPLLVVDLGL